MLECRTLMAVTIFTIDSFQSTLTLGGQAASVAIFGQPSTNPASATTHYSGSISANVDSSLIQFDGSSSSLQAVVNGSYLPGPQSEPSTPTPGDYGLSASLQGATIDAAVRNLTAAISSSSLALAKDGTFNGAGLDLLPSAELDYNSEGSAPQEQPIDPAGAEASNTPSSPARLVDDGTIQTLTLPIDATLSAASVPGLPGSVTLVFQGTLIATAPRQRTVSSARRNRIEVSNRQRGFNAYHCRWHGFWRCRRRQWQ